MTTTIPFFAFTNKFTVFILARNLEYNDKLLWVAANLPACCYRENPLEKMVAHDRQDSEYCHWYI